MCSSNYYPAIIQCNFCSIQNENQLKRKHVQASCIKFQQAMQSKKKSQLRILLLLSLFEGETLQFDLEPKQWHFPKLKWQMFLDLQVQHKGITVSATSFVCSKYLLAFPGVAPCVPSVIMPRAKHARGKALKFSHLHHQARKYQVRLFFPKQFSS
jgi:hypothetical protein